MGHPGFGNLGPDRGGHRAEPRDGGTVPQVHAALVLAAKPNPSKSNKICRMFSSGCPVMRERCLSLSGAAERRSESVSAARMGSDGDTVPAYMAEPPRPFPFYG